MAHYITIEQISNKFKEKYAICDKKPLGKGEGFNV